MRELDARAATILPADCSESAQEMGRLIGDESNRFWIARLDDVPLGYVAAHMAEDDCADIVQAPDTVSIVGAYVLPAHRRSGIATELVNQVVTWARENGHPRVAVDFESANAPARAFWLAPFTPVTRALVRTVDPRLV